MIEHDIDIGGSTIHFHECGKADEAALLLLHGWPQSARCWFDVMANMSGLRVLAPDLPGIGASVGRPPKGDKRGLAGLLVQAMDHLGAGRFSVAGHDVGGMVAYALLRAHPERLRCAAILNAAIPGIEPWPRVIADPRLWHFGFHQVSGLPEMLVTDHLRAYFDFFYATLADGADRVPAQNKDAHCYAYSRPGALSAGFDWYRAFPEDAEWNAKVDAPCTVPLLYMRSGGDADGMDSYVRGFQAAGVSKVETAFVRDSGHFVLEEKPAEVAEALTRFVAEFGWAELSAYP